MISRFSQKHVEFLIGVNLDDNEWHTVNILRTETLNEFILDKENKVSLSPPSFKSLSINESFYIGGINHSYLSNLPKSVMGS